MQYVQDMDVYHIVRPSTEFSIALCATLIFWTTFLLVSMFQRHNLRQAEHISNFHLTMCLKFTNATHVSSIRLISLCVWLYLLYELRVQDIYTPSLSTMLIFTPTSWDAKLDVVALSSHDQHCRLLKLYRPQILGM